MEQELLTPLEHLCEPPSVVSGVRVTQSLVLYTFCICFVDRCSFVRFLLATVLSVLLRYTDSDYPFGIFKLFLRLLYHVARRNILILHTMSNISHLYRYLITDKDEISVSFLHFKTGSHGKINRILYKSYTIFVVYDTSFISNN